MDTLIFFMQKDVEKTRLWNLCVNIAQSSSGVYEVNVIE